MKFMKLGSKPDTFQADGKFLRYVSCDLSPDITVSVGEVMFLLHKFPLVSKSKRLRELVAQANEENSNEVALVELPGGPKAFEICAKFSYGMTVTLNAYNVAAARCAAEYLQMNEDAEKGNLIFKIEVFLNSSIFRTWKDSLILLQTTKSLPGLCEDLNIAKRCIDSISSRTSINPAKVTWSYTYNRGLSRENQNSIPGDWWVEDICELDVDLFTRVMMAIRSKGKTDGIMVAEALRTYAFRWLPDSVELGSAIKYKYLVETLIFLLQLDKAATCACSFLLKLTKVAILVGVEDATREDLLNRISYGLHEASVKDLLMFGDSSEENVELVKYMVDMFMVRQKSANRYKGKNVEDDGFVLGNGALLDVGKLIDGYLAEIAQDPNLSLISFMSLCQAIPESARPIHDNLYRAIDSFLKAHPSLSKSERKRVCMMMDVKRLTMEASVHAAQNELLPLRVVVQVLYFEQVRAAGGQGGDHDVDTPATSIDSRRSLTTEMSRLSVREDESLRNGKMDGRKSVKMTPSRSRRIFDKLRGVGKGSGERSGSSMSQVSFGPGENKSSGSSSRHGRHSIS